MTHTSEIKSILVFGAKHVNNTSAFNMINCIHGRKDCQIIICSNSFMKLMALVKFSPEYVSKMEHIFIISILHSVIGMYLSKQVEVAIL